MEPKGASEKPSLSRKEYEEKKASYVPKRECLLCKGPHRLTECPRFLEEESDEEDDEFDGESDEEADDEVEEDDLTDGQGAHQDKVVVDEGNDLVDGTGSHQHEAKGAATRVECSEDEAMEEGPRREDIQLHKNTRVEEPRKEAAETKDEECFQRDSLGHIDGSVSKRGATLFEEARGRSIKFAERQKVWVLVRRYPPRGRNKAHRVAKNVGGRKPSMVHGRASIVGAKMAREGTRMESSLVGTTRNWVGENVTPRPLAERHGSREVRECWNGTEEGRDVRGNAWRPRFNGKRRT